MTASVTGNDGSTVTYLNDTDRSLVTSVTDPTNVVTSNTYDTMRRPVTSQTGNSAITNSYSDDLLVGLSHTNTANTSTDYTLEYTTANLLSKVKVGSTYTLAENSYNPGTWTLARQDYGNGAGWAYSYSEFNDLTARWTTYGEEGVEFRYFYNSEGKLARVEQYDTTLASGTITSRTLVNTERYYYDSGNRLTRVWETDVPNNQHEFRWTYDSNDQVIELVETVNGRTFSYTNSYNGDKQPTQSSFGSVQENFSYDGLGRLSQVVVNESDEAVLTTGYTYRDLDTTRTTTQVSALQNSYGNQSESLTYTYDVKGNILSVSDGTNTTLYEYDALNELTWEKNAEEEKAWHYSYDLGGNILSKEEYSYQNGVVGGTPLSTVSYTYGDANWPDLLTVYNGIPITYDGMGNPTSYRGWSFTWQGGRQLAVAEKGTTSLSFQYNETGLRTRKTVGSEIHRYVYRGSTLAAEITGSYALYFNYDARGEIVGFDTAIGGHYFFIKNLQGDVIGIVDVDGISVAEYRYDAWGKVLEATGSMASINPIRYRGYYFDAETELYYLHSRYYDPEVGRFINADAFASTGQGILGANMFAYCGNEPISCRDSGGYSPGEYYEVLSVSSEKKGQDDEGSNLYVITIDYSFSRGDPFFGLDGPDYQSVTVEFKITPSGIVKIDNKTLDSTVINNRTIGIRIAEEMLAIAKDDYPDYEYLFGRTAAGIYFEMITHYFASCVNYKPNADETDIGGTNPQKAGYDSNADAFEHPLRNIGIWIDMFS